MIRAFTPADYTTIVEWWKAHNFPPIPLSHLPHTGFIADELCAGFLYQSDSAIGWVEWIVANPASEAAVRHEALDKLIEALCARATELEIKMLFTSVQHPGLLERYKKHGFFVGDTNMTNLARYV